jgi:hypothetical protein
MLPGYQWRHSWIKNQRCGMAQLICGDIVHRISCLALLRKVPVLWFIGHVLLFFMSLSKTFRHITTMCFIFLYICMKKFRLYRVFLE